MWKRKSLGEFALSDSEGSDGEDGGVGVHPAASIPRAGGTFGFGGTCAVDAMPKPQNKRHCSENFRRSMEELNLAFIKSVEEAVSKDSGGSLVPLVKDNLQYNRNLLEELREERGNGRNGLVQPTPPSNSFQSLGEYFDNLEKKMASGGHPSLTPPTQVPQAFPTPPTEPPPFIPSAALSFYNKLKSMPLNGGVDRADASSNQNQNAPVPRDNSPDKPDGVGVEAERQDMNGEAEGDDEDFEREGSPDKKFTPIPEENAIYFVPCKVYNFKDGAWKVKGVGTLYLKKLEGSNLHQILVRTDSSVGTVVLNVLLNKDLSLQKNSRNGILTSEVSPQTGKGVPTVVKVETEEMRDQLLEVMQKLQEMPE